MDRLPGRLATTLWLITLTGCSLISPTMTAMNIRAALDECQEMKLDSLVYQRPDHSIIAIRCVPRPDDVHDTVTLRKRNPIQLMKPFCEKIEIQE